jgi:hypothetical protein
MGASGPLANGPRGSKGIASDRTNHTKGVYAGRESNHAETFLLAPHLVAPAGSPASERSERAGQEPTEGRLAGF